jgi:hypothetical protein
LKEFLFILAVFLIQPKQYNNSMPTLNNINISQDKLTKLFFDSIYTGDLELFTSLLPHLKNSINTITSTKLLFDGVLTDICPLAYCCLTEIAENPILIDMVKSLILAGADLNSKTLQYTPIAIAASRGKVQIINELLKSNPELNNVDSKGYTALIHATLNRNVEIVQALINAGCDTSIKSITTGLTALDYAESSNKQELIKPFLQNTLTELSITTNRPVTKHTVLYVNGEKFTLVKVVPAKEPVKINNNYPDKLSIGTKVVRGPTWRWDEQDGGDGNIGIVIDSDPSTILSSDWVRVKWENNSINTYEYLPAKNKFDIIPV